MLEQTLYRREASFSPMPPGEEDGVQAAHSSSKAADVFLDLVSQNVHGQLGSLVALLSGGDDLTHIAGNAGNTFHTGLLVEHVGDILNGFALFLTDVVEDGGVHRPERCP